MKRAIVITPGGHVHILLIPNYPSELKTLQGAVGGYIEMVPHNLPNFTVYCDEDGKLKRRVPNELATALFGPPGDIIVGPVVVLGPIDEKGDSIGLTQEQVAIFLTAEGGDILNALAELNR